MAMSDSEPRSRDASLGLLVRSGRLLSCGWKKLVTQTAEDEPDIGYSSLLIGRIPAELLAEVLLWYIRDAHATTEARRIPYWPRPDEQQPTDDHWRQPPAPYSWLVIRHVCHFWRQVALTFPHLSTHIFLTRPDCVQDLLGRAGDLPLTVDNPGLLYSLAHSADVLAASTLMLAHVDRIVDGGFMLLGRTPPVDFARFPFRACNIQGLRIGSMFHQYPVLPFPPDLDFPELRRLACYHVDITTLPALLPLSQLRDLDLDSCGRIPASVLLVFLGSVQGLEELKLRLVISDDEHWPHIGSSDVVPPLGTRVSLPKLRYLNLRESLGATGLFFLHHIAHPPTTSLHLSFLRLSQGPHSQCDCLLMMLLRTIDGWHRAGAPTFRSLYLAMAQCPYFEVRLWQDHLPVSGLASSATGGRPFFSLDIFSEYPAFSAALLQRLPLHSVSSAHVAQRFVSPDLYPVETILSSLTALEELALAYNVPKGTESPTGLPAPAVSDMLCPLLKALRVEETEYDPVTDVQRDLPPVSVAIAGIANGLRSRAARDAQDDHSNSLHFDHIRHYCEPKQELHTSPSRSFFATIFGRGRH